VGYALCYHVDRPGNAAMIASDAQQRIDRLAEQLGNLRGYL
jgi:hypothetical protein